VDDDVSYGEVKVLSQADLALVALTVFALMIMVR
jgi:hypothetical protein